MTELEPTSRRSRLVGDLFRREGAKGVAVALLSTAVVLFAIGWLVVHSKNWPAVKDSFFNAQEFRDSFPDIAQKFVRNIEYFLIGEVFILSLALFLAVLRSLPGPVFFPLRALAITYVDLFRGIPTILVIYILGFGVPSLGLRGVPVSATFWGLVGLVLSYSAYVSEVYRAGIESVHPSQVGSARSLGLTRLQALRFVIVPQAVRRVIPPLLNDFVALQKDTALVAFVVAVPEAFKEAQIIQNADFNFTPLVAAALLFLLITVPLTRLVDWLSARERGRRQGGAVL
ncbi:MAG: amino acid ABC transporter permease [Actinobacteria bacterium]|nr:MAG: amino acid ABC transporter permease [Actinomycetota bacterium]